MKRISFLQHRFVESVPEEMENGVLYVALNYASIMHLCACGCGREVVTPLSPKDWNLTFDGKTISLNPSIGSWSLPCRSHYSIRKGHVKWVDDWSDSKVTKAREYDLFAKRGINPDQEKVNLTDLIENTDNLKTQSFFKSLWSRLTFK